MDGISGTTEHKTQQTQRINLPYIKNIVEMTSRFLQPWEITIVHRPSETVRILAWKPLEQLKLKKCETSYTKVKCTNCDKCYNDQNGKKHPLECTNPNRVQENMILLVLTSIEETQEGNRFNVDAVEILNQLTTRHSENFSKACYSLNQSVNRQHELDRLCRANCSTRAESRESRLAEPQPWIWITLRK